jgi:hypothetical protein
VIDACEESLPIDAAPPALDAARAHGLATILGRSGLHLAPAHVVVLKHRPGHRCTVLLEAPDRRVVFKAYATDPSPIAEVLRHLSERGLGSGRPPTIAPVEAFDRDLRFLVTGWLDGPRARELLAKDEGDRAGELGATWLRASRNIEAAPEARRLDTRAVLRRVHRWADFLASVDPELGSGATTVVKELALRTPIDGKYELRHGSFSPSHIFDLGSGPGLIDWDSFCLGPIELDAGNFLAVLARIGTGGRRLEIQTSRAARTFREQVSDLVRPDILAWFGAGMLVKHARYTCMRRPPQWLDRAGALLSEAAASLKRLDVSGSFEVS